MEVEAELVEDFIGQLFGARKSFHAVTFFTVDTDTIGNVIVGDGEGWSVFFKEGAGFGGEPNCCNLTGYL